MSPEPLASLALALEAFDWQAFLYALGLLALAAALLLLEFLVVSFGLLLLAATASVGGAIVFAFRAGTAVGWAFAVATPILAVILTRWGLRRVARSHVVPKAEVTAEAGYHHLADRLGVAPGATGEMVTPARPTGRARFEGGECDVQARGGTLERGARVVVESIEGPVVFVVPAPAPPVHG